MNRLVPAIVSACLVLASGGCTLVLDGGQEQCETTADCTKRGFMSATCVKNVCEEQPTPPPDPTWGCLGHVVAPVPDPTKMVTLTESLVLAVGGAAVPMATVDVCAKLDVDCTETSPGFPKGLMSDTNGNVTFSVAQGFDGFVRISGTNIMDSRVYVGRPVITPPNVKAIELLRPADYTLLANVAKQTVDMTRGSAILLAFDCQDDSGAGVSFECPAADSETQAFYLINQLPTAPPAATATDVDGFGGFFNLPVGTTIAKSYRAAGNVYIGESSFDVLAYTISYVLVSPHPELTMKADRLGKYRIIALLGQGGMASVFLSVVPGPLGVNKLLVVKLLRDELSQDEDFLAMFLNEARLAARLNHANVVQTYEIGLEDGHHFLAMDYLDGQPLHAILRKASRSGVPLDVHVRILAEMLAGLHYAHTLTDFDGTPLRVVHRDVSPQNVFITYDGQVKVVDFGIAKAVGASSNTQSGMFKGKLSYVAPEQAAGGAVDARADVFSVGVMLWEAIAGRRFAQGDTQSAVLGRRLSGREPRIREVVPNVDPELSDICDRAMAHDPAARFATAQELRDALEGFLDRSSRRVGAREVALFLTGLFAEEREKIRIIIDEQMKRLQRETNSTLPMPTLDVFPGARDPTPITTVESRAAAERAAAALRGTGSGPAAQEGGTGSVSRTHGTLVAANISQAPPPGGPNARTLLVALAVLAIAVAGALVAVLLVKGPSSPQAAAPADTAADAAKIKLSITYGPPGTIAKLDGVPLAQSPFVAQTPRDGSMHRIDVEGAGLKPETRMVSYEKDVLVTVSLQAAEAAPPPPADTAPPAVTAAPADPGKRAPGSGSDRQKPVKPARGIDEKDPYKQ